MNNMVPYVTHTVMQNTTKIPINRKFSVFEIRQEHFSFEEETQTKNDVPVLEDFIFLSHTVISNELIPTNLLDLKLDYFYMHTLRKVIFRDQLLNEISLELLSIICCLRSYHQNHHCYMKILKEITNSDCKKKHKVFLTLLSLGLLENLLFHVFSYLRHENWNLQISNG